MSYEENYIKLVDKVSYGDSRESRAGPVKGIFGTTLFIDDLERHKFPVLTTRQMQVKPILGELAAFVRGSEWIDQFKEFGCNYWDKNALNWSGNDGVSVNDLRIGKLYGAKWRNFHGIDQLADLIDNLETDPTGRRHLMSTWDPSETDQCLPPCHLLVQYYIKRENVESCVYMRSVDVCLGLPSDVVLYATMQLLVAQSLELNPGTITFFMGDTHMYKNHVESWRSQRHNPIGEPPGYELYEGSTLFNFEPDHLSLVNYRSDLPRVNYVLNV